MKRYSRIKISCADLRRLYNSGEMSQSDIAILYSTTRQTIHNKMESCGIDARSRSDARVMSISQGKIEYGGEYVDKLETCIKIALADSPHLRLKLSRIIPELVGKFAEMLGLPSVPDD